MKFNNILLRVASSSPHHALLCNVEMLAGMNGYLKDLGLNLLQKKMLFALLVILLM